MLAILNILTENSATNSNPSISKTKTLLGKVYSISRIYIKFTTFWKKTEPRSLTVLEVNDCDQRGNFNG